MKKSFVALSFAALTIFIIFSICVILLIVFLLYPRNTNSNASSSYEYQYQEFDLSQNKPSIGFSTLNTPLQGEEDYMSYHNEETGGYVIISQFVSGSNRFGCTGSCSCLQEKRRTSAVLNRGLFLIVSAVSTFMASKIATEVFKDRCVQQYSETCDPSNIHAEVKSCSEDDSVETSDSDCERDERGATFVHNVMCDGHCVENGAYQTLRLEKGIKVKPPCQGMHLGPNFYEVETAGMVPPIESETLASKLHQEKLIPFCEQYQLPGSEAFENPEGGLIHPCSAIFPGTEGTMKFPNVRCMTRESKTKNEPCEK